MLENFQPFSCEALKDGTRSLGELIHTHRPYIHLPSKKSQLRISHFAVAYFVGQPTLHPIMSGEGISEKTFYHKYDCIDLKQCNVYLHENTFIQIKREAAIQCTGKYMPHCFFSSSIFNQPIIQPLPELYKEFFDVIAIKAYKIARLASFFHHPS